MANYGQPAVIIEIGSASGAALGSLKPISNYVDTINGVELEALIQQSDAFGDSWQESLYTGIKKMTPITISGFYDDVAASGPHALMGQTSDLGADRLFEISMGASDVVNGRCIIQKYTRAPSRNQLTRYTAVLQPTGAIGTTT